MVPNNNDLLAAALYFTVCALALWLMFWTAGAFA